MKLIFQNLALLIVSYTIYIWLCGDLWWLLLLATATTFAAGWAVERLMQQSYYRVANMLTTLGVIALVGLLIVFKYLDFFAEEIAAGLRFIGISATWNALHLLLPVGLSFYVFKLISYLVEIHREHLKAERDFICFAAYISFFPTLLAGPIDRPAQFLPQLHRARHFTWDALIAGGKMVLWGAVMKVCIADALSPVTHLAWDTLESGSRLTWWAFWLYPIEMYADFSGYSLMAIGIGRILGFEVTTNFRTPFIARNVAEYWRRWHMSLTSWITDYIFMPINLRLRDWKKAGLAIAVTVNMAIIGLWHGASWTYLLFGLYHALLFLPLIYSGNFAKRKKLRTTSWGLPTLHDCGKMLLTYFLVAIAFVLFRAPDVASACSFFQSLFMLSIPSMPYVSGSRWGYLLLIAFVMVWEYVQRDKLSPLHLSGRGFLRYRAVRYLFYYALLLLLYIHSDHTGSTFIYSQF